MNQLGQKNILKQFVLGSAISGVDLLGYLFGIVNSFFNDELCFKESKIDVVSMRSLDQLGFKPSFFTPTISQR